MSAVKALLIWIANYWRQTRLSKTNLGKYIILYASVLHWAWAALLLFWPAAAMSTPVAILVRIFGGTVRTGFALLIVGTMAISLPFMGKRASNRLIAGLLIPQQMVLVMSAGGGLLAVFAQRYADGVLRPWPFILADQLPNILIALLYTVVVVTAAFAPTERERREEERADE